jgi:hypothetical protein
MLKLARFVAFKLDIEADWSFALVADRSCRLELFMAFEMPTLIVVWAVWFSRRRNFHFCFPLQLSSERSESFSPALAFTTTPHTAHLA